MPRALLVEKSSTFSKYFISGLRQKFPGLEIQEATNKGKALYLLNSFEPDLVLIDIHLSDCNGFDLSKLMKGIRPNVIIILLASYSLPEYQYATYDSGADYFLSNEMPLEKYFSLIDSIIYSG